MSVLAGWTNTVVLSRKLANGTRVVMDRQDPRGRWIVMADGRKERGFSDLESAAAYTQFVADTNGGWRAE